jgi:hypothetical protein
MSISEKTGLILERLKTENPDLFTYRQRFPDGSLFIPGVYQADKARYGALVNPDDSILCLITPLDEPESTYLTEWPSTYLDTLGGRGCDDMADLILQD